MMTEFVFFGELSHYVILEQNEKCRYIVLRYILRKKQLFPAAQMWAILLSALRRPLSKKKTISK